MSDFKEVLGRIKELMIIKEDIEQYRDKFSTDYKGTTIIKVNLDMILSRLKKDSPSFYVDPNTDLEYHKNKINKAVNYFKKNVIEDNPLSVYYPPFLTIYDDELGVVEGRHRLAAYYHLGFTNVYIEVLESQVELFKPFMV
jgi:hypothetical protein